MGNQEMNLQNSIRDNFIVALVAYIKICEPKQIARDLNTISKYFSEVSGDNLNKDIDYPSDKTCEEISSLVEQIRNDIKK